MTSRDPSRNSPAVIIIGASSGIGRALAVEYARAGYRVGVTARREALLAELCAELPGQATCRAFDIAQTEEAIPALEGLIQDMGDVDGFVISAAVGNNNPTFEWTGEHETLSVNVMGCAAMINVAAAHLQKRGRGHLVGLSSIAAIRGIGRAPAYAASKAFLSNYLHGLRYRFMRLGLPIIVTDVQPGFVDTRLAAAKFWMASPEVAARQIVNAVRKGRTHVYITRRWRLIAWLIRIVPDALWGRL